MKQASMTAGRSSNAFRRLSGLVLALTLLAEGAPVRGAEDRGSPANFTKRDHDRYSFEYYRRHGAFGRRGERLDPNDPRGHMSHGHGVGHR